MTTEPTTPAAVPDRAVQIAESVLPLVARSGEIAIVRATVAALARDGWLTPPDRRAALEAVAEAARKAPIYPALETADLLEALSALDPAEAGK